MPELHRLFYFFLIWATTVSAVWSWRRRCNCTIIETSTTSCCLNNVHLHVDSTMLFRKRFDVAKTSSTSCWQSTCFDNDMINEFVKTSTSCSLVTSCLENDLMNEFMNDLVLVLVTAWQPYWSLKPGDRRDQPLQTTAVALAALKSATVVVPKHHHCSAAFIHRPYRLLTGFGQLLLASLTSPSPSQSPSGHY